MLEWFLADDETQSIIMIGEIGGSAKKKPRSSSRDEAKRGAASPWPALSPDAQPLRAVAWAMPARLSPVAKVVRKTKSKLCKAAGIVVAESPAGLGEAVLKAIG